MELLLNLAWLLVAFSALAALRPSQPMSRKNRFGSLEGWLALGCLLVVLFPVISATDDLCAMRAEIEECPASKRTVRQASTDRASSWNNRLQSPPAQVPELVIFVPSRDNAPASPAKPDRVLAGLYRSADGRAPPSPA